MFLDSFWDYWRPGTCGLVQGDRPDSIVSVVFVGEGRSVCSDLVLEPLLQLQRDSKVDLSVFFEQESSDGDLRRAVRKSDVLVSFRTCSRRSLRLLLHAKKLGVAIVWASDDDLLELTSDNPVGARFESKKRQSTIRQCMSVVDSIWLYSEAMEEKYSSLKIPTFLSKVPPPKVQFSAEECTDEPFKIGHIGDFTHVEETKILLETISHLEKLASNIEWSFEFVGHTPLSLIGHPRVKSVPYVDGVENFHRWLSESGWSVGVAPLRDTPFNRMKTDNKFRTFASFGIPGVYSAIRPYLDSVEHESTGLLVEHNGVAFAEAIYRLMHVSELRMRLRQQARSVMDKDYDSKWIASKCFSQLLRISKKYPKEEFSHRELDAA